MSRRMSCALTIDAVKERRKTVTRRHVDSWQTLKPGDRLTLIEKGMGLPKGATQAIIGEVEVVSVTVERLLTLTYSELEREGFQYGEPYTLRSWCDWWMIGHGYKPGDDPLCRRIEWRYLTETPA